MVAANSSLLAAYDYVLPEDVIAQRPVEPRSAARLLVDLGAGPEHHTVADLPELLAPGDVVVVNETKVLPARLLLQKAGSGGRAEVLLLEPAGGDRWVALVRPGRRLRPGTLLVSPADGVTAVVEVGDPVSSAASAAPGGEPAPNETGGPIDAGGPITAGAPADAATAVADDAANAPAPDVASPVADDAANVPAPRVASAVADDAANAPAPDVASAVADDAANAPVPDVASAVADDAANVPAPDVASAVADDAASALADDGRRFVRLLDDPERHGAVPLPPYIHEPLADPGRYQTVYAKAPGSVASPTAGLHLTDDVLAGLARRGIEVHAVDLAIGLDTFRPISAERIADHRMHSERYRVPTATSRACAAARARHSRVVAIGTTTVRALESHASTGKAEGRTDLFITPGFEFKAVDVLLTNFHMPKSSLLVLLAAFAGEQRWRRLYELALGERYRFLSFGDAMLVSRASPAGLVSRASPAGAVGGASQTGPVDR